MGPRHQVGQVLALVAGPSRAGLVQGAVGVHADAEVGDRGQAVHVKAGALVQGPVGGEPEDLMGLEGCGVGQQRGGGAGGAVAGASGACPVVRSPSEPSMRVMSNGPGAVATGGAAAWGAPEAPGSAPLKRRRPPASTIAAKAPRNDGRTAGPPRRWPGLRAPARPPSGSIPGGPPPAPSRRPRVAGGARATSRRPPTTNPRPAPAQRRRPGPRTGCPGPNSAANTTGGPAGRRPA